MLRTTRVAGAVALAVCVALCACSSSNNNSNNGSGGSGGSGAGGAGGTSYVIPDLCVTKTPSPDVTDISGHWAFQTIGSQVVQASALSPFHTRVVSLLLVDLTESGKDVTMKASYCAQRVDTDSKLAQTVLPDAFVKALAPYTRNGTYEVSGGMGHFKSPPFPEVLGAKLADPMNDALPTDPTDSRVFDQDKDGNPGMTIKITGLITGSADVVQRLTSSYDGVAVDKDHLQGKLGFKSEQNILDSNPTAIKDQSPKGSIDPVACNSHFDATRLSAGADCQYVVDNAATLFPAN